MTRLQRLHKRLATAQKFSREGFGFTDRVKLFFAGVARGGPFGKATTVGRVLRGLAGSVQVRVEKCPGKVLQLDLTDLVDVIVFEEIFLEGVYPMQEISFYPSQVIDAGSCRGVFTLVAHDSFPEATFVAIEPEPNNVVRLREHLSLNDLEVEVVEAAVSLSDEPITFKGSGFGGSICEESAVDESAKKVEAFNLVKFVEQSKADSLLLKMDIEGSERGVLPLLADRLPQRTVIFLETHHEEEVCDVYLKPFRESGFRERVVRQRNSDELGDRYVERVFVRD